MVFWAGILVGATFAWSVMKMGFYETWAFLFNIVISVYLAVFLGPIIANVIAADDAPYSNAVAMIATAVGTFLILHGISYTFLTGQFTIPFPRILDTLGTGFLGFLAGFLVWSFVSLLICITPISQQPIVKEMGFGNQFEQTNAPYISWWCNLVNTVVSRQDSKQTTEQAISELLKSVEKKTPAKMAKQDRAVEPNEPNDVKTSTAEEDLPAPPPEADVDDI